jgi:hypothetical protein
LVAALAITYSFTARRSPVKQGGTSRMRELDIRAEVEGRVFRR